MSKHVDASQCKILSQLLCLHPQEMSTSQEDAPQQEPGQQETGQEEQPGQPGPQQEQNRPQQEQERPHNNTMRNPHIKKRGYWSSEPFLLIS